MWRSMRRLLIILLPLVVGAAQAEPIPASPLFLNSRTIILSCQSANEAAIDTVHVWVSTGEPISWHKAKVGKTDLGAVQYEAHSDGKYSFYIVLENKQGRSAADPIAGSKPHLSVIVDTTPPTLQLHAIKRLIASEKADRLRLRLSLVDENLGTAGTRLFYRANSETGWQDAGPVMYASGIISWQPPADLPSSIDLRVCATDLAGNQAVDELADVRINDLETMPGRTVAAESAPVLEPVVVPPVEPVTVTPLSPVILGEVTAQTPTSQPSMQKSRQAERLHEQALRFLSEGRLSLASTRLNDALKITPDNPDLQTDLGSILFRAKQYNKAAQHFQQAIEDAPEHIGAIEGLALVAVNQKRYPDARTYVQQLLKLCPDSGEHWMHLGDVEHMLGNNLEARAAWNKALELEQTDDNIRKDVETRLRMFGKEAAPLAK